MSATESSVQAAPAGGAEHFGDAVWGQLRHFAQLLADEGEMRGLVGPRELGKLWDRHILNSLAIVPDLPEKSDLVDIGSGAGFPGIVVAIVRPDLQVDLVETMARRCEWLEYVVDKLGLENVRVIRARAEEIERGRYSFVTARAVAPLKKLVPWALPLLRSGGELIALKGGRAEQEIDEASAMLRKYRADWVDIFERDVWGSDEGTRVVVVAKQ